MRNREKEKKIKVLEIENKRHHGNVAVSSR